MFKNLRQIWNPKNKDIKKRIGYTLFALLIFAIGNTITVPGMKAVVKDLGFLEYLNAISGGGLKKFTIFGLGVMPYISASIIVSILQMDIIPYFSDLKYDDLDVKVIDEFGGYPIPDNRPMWAPISYAPEYTAVGRINYWTYVHEITEEDVEGYIVDVLHQEPTEELINKVTLDDIYEYLVDKYREFAEEDAKENYDYDEVDWEDPD